MNAHDKDRQTQLDIERKCCRLIPLYDARTLRRASMALHRWAERECNGEIERDDETGKPYAVTQRSTGALIRYPAPDLEAGALRRVKEVCDRNGRF